MRQDDINSLLEDINTKYGALINDYNKSLNEKNLNGNLKINIKNYLENSRSILDYLAHDIAEKYNINIDIIYFPIVGKDKNINNFIRSVNRNLPNLQILNSNLYKYIEKLQPYNVQNEWLSYFIEITNCKKHNNLIPQTKQIESFISSISPNGNNVSWNPNYVKFGGGEGVQVYINGDLVNHQNQMPINSGNNIIKKEIWVDYIFDGYNYSAIFLIKKIYENIGIIVNDIYSLLK